MLCSKVNADGFILLSLIDLPFGFYYLQEYQPLSYFYNFAVREFLSALVYSETFSI